MDMIYSVAFENDKHYSLSELPVKRYDKSLVYISHPSGGKEYNTLDIQRIVEILVSNDYFFENFTYVSPVHNFGFMYNTLDYEKGLNLCLDLLNKCDVMLVFGDYTTSTGCKREIEYCIEHDIPYTIVKDLDNWMDV